MKFNGTELVIVIGSETITIARPSQAGTEILNASDEVPDDV
jgi:hypothetical protein